MIPNPKVERLTGANSNKAIKIGCQMEISGLFTCTPIHLAIDAIEG